MNMGEVLLAQGKPEHSLKYCDDALGLCLNNDKNLAQHKATVLLTKSRCLERQGQLDNAMECLEEALSKASVNSNVPMNNQMVVGASTGNVVKGIIGGQNQMIQSTKQVLIQEI
jgi:tetratricopeptide (TPR) repeat protein